MANAQPVIQVDVNGVPVSASGGASTNLVSVGGANIVLGQTSSTSSLPVTLANDQSIAITGAVTASGSVQSIPGTSGGLALSSTIIPNNTTAIVVKASAGQLYGIKAYNNSAVIAYIKVYNATSATAGSGTPVDRHMIPAPAAGGGGGFIWSDTNGVTFSTGITFIVTTGILDNDTAAPAASAYIINFYYK